MLGVLPRVQQLCDSDRRESAPAAQGGVNVATDAPFGYRAGIARPTNGSALVRRGRVLQRDGDRNGVA